MNVTVGTVEAKTAPLSTVQTDNEPVAFVRQAKETAKGVSLAAAQFAQDDLRPGTGAYASKKAAGTTFLMQDAKDVSSRDMDIVLAHTLSGKDYEKAKADGYDPSELSPGETVTIIDHIKASLLQSGKEIAGVTDDLSEAQLTEITGSAAYARELAGAFFDNDIPLTKDNVSAVTDAVARAQELSPLTDETVYYMVENEIPPTTNDLYLATHSAKGRGAHGAFFEEAGGYLQTTAPDSDLTSLKPQIDEVIRKAGFDPADEEIQKEAAGLIDAQVTLTADHLRKAHTLHTMEMPPVREDVIRAGAAAIAEGKDAAMGDLSDPRSIYAKAVETDRAVQALTEDDVREALSAQPEETEDDLTLSDLTAAAERRHAEVSAPPVLNEKQETRFLEARLQLEEVRLSMSASTNLTLLRQGFEIDTAPMEALIDALKQAIRTNGSVFFEGEASVRQELTVTDGATRYRLYTETNLKVSYLRDGMPAGVLGALKDEFKTDTLDDIFTKAQTWKVADSAYEAMQTEVRSDLGDSIKKAFGNASSLLKDIGLRDTADNLRAVRILGYNRMEISADNVREIRALDAKLDDIINGLKPAAVLDMIREGKNPLTMTMNELSAELSKRNEEQSASDEQYARFLYKLDHAHEISKEERASFIGIYRMFETLKKTDHAAIGHLLQTGAEMSVKNLLTATRSMKAARGGICFTADDTADGHRITDDSTAIDRQIETAFTYYSAKADSAFAHLAPEKLQAMPDPQETLLPEFAEQMETLPEDTQTSNDFDLAQLTALRENARMTDAAALERELAAGDLRVNTANLEAMRMLRASANVKTRQSLWEEADFGEEDAARFDDITDETKDPGETYAQAAAAMQQKISGRMASADISYVDHRALSLAHRALTVAAGMARKGSFEIPVEKNGRTISMRVTLSGEGETGASALVTMDTKDYGTLSARMRISDGEVESILTTTYGQTPQTKAYMEDVRARLTEGINREVEGVRAQADRQTLVYQTAPAEGAFDGGFRRASQRTLLQLAKVFARTI